MSGNRWVNSFKSSTYRASSLGIDANVKVLQIFYFIFLITIPVNTVGGTEFGCLHDIEMINKRIDYAKYKCKSDPSYCESNGFLDSGIFFLCDNMIMQCGKFDITTHSLSLSVEPPDACKDYFTSTGLRLKNKRKN